MHIDRYMVNLFFEIRRNLPAELQTDLKIADPKISDKLIDLHHSINDENIKRLVEVFFERAGDNWVNLLTQKRNYYRGNEIVNKERLPEKQNIVIKVKPPKPKRIYRGQVVLD